jgi:DNA-binding response OmpR family regulator
MIAPVKPLHAVHSPEILLVEHSTMIGNIIVSTARQLGLRPIRLVTSCRSAQHYLEHQAIDGLITSLDDEEETLALIEKLRTGSFRSASNVPVAITTAQCSAQLAARMKVFNVRRILLKPFKIRDLVVTIEDLVEKAEG